jgi:ADP-ribose pyrophosphatase YjhB (NUDIX family)
LLLFNNKKILLLLRNNTGFGDGLFGVVGGHIEGNEKATDAIIREAKEEISIDLNVNHLRLVGTIHRKLDDNEYIDLFFLANSWTGQILNNEPNKHSRIIWVDPQNLPANTLPFVRKAIINYLNGKVYEEVGW